MYGKKSDIHMPVLSPMDAALFRLNSHPDVKPGMTMDEVEQRLLVFDVDLEISDVAQLAAMAAASDQSELNTVGLATEDRCENPRSDSVYSDVVDVLTEMAWSPQSNGDLSLSRVESIGAEPLHRIHGSLYIHFPSKTRWATGSDVVVDILIDPGSYQVVNAMLDWDVHTTRYFCRKFQGFVNVTPTPIPAPSAESISNWTDAAEFMLAGRVDATRHADYNQEGCDGEPASGDYYSDVSGFLRDLLRDPFNPRTKAEFGIDAHEYVYLEGRTHIAWSSAVWATGADVRFRIYADADSGAIERFTLEWGALTKPGYHDYCNVVTGWGD